MSMEIAMKTTVMTVEQAAVVVTTVVTAVATMKTTSLLSVIDNVGGKLNGARGSAMVTDSDRHPF